MKVQVLDTIFAFSPGNQGYGTNIHIVYVAHLSSSLSALLDSSSCLSRCCHYFPLKQLNLDFTAILNVPALSLCKSITLQSMVQEDLYA